MAEFISSLVTEGHLGSWMYYILAFIERNPLSMFYSLFIVSFGIYMIRKVLFGG